MTFEPPKTIEQTLSLMVQMAGGHRRVAFALWPEKSPKRAATDLLGKLNPNHRNKLSLDEFCSLVRIAHQIGFHMPMEMLCEQVGYTKPAPVNSADQIAELQKRFLREAASFGHLIKKTSPEEFEEAFAEAEADDKHRWREIYERRRQFDKKRDELMVRLAERDGPLCSKCGSSDDLSVDHIQPLSKGGSDELENLQILCLSCNISKGDKWHPNVELKAVK